MKGFGVFLIILAIVFFCLGFFKMVVYENSLGINVYVNGDAYNYIINANYFTGFSVLGGSCLIGGILLIVAGKNSSSLNNDKDSDNPYMSYMYFCPNCKQMYSAQSNNKDLDCKDCHWTLYSTNIKRVDWDALSNEAQKNYKKQWTKAFKETYK